MLHLKLKIFSKEWQLELVHFVSAAFALGPALVAAVGISAGTGGAIVGGVLGGAIFEGSGYGSFLEGVMFGATIGYMGGQMGAEFGNPLIDSVSMKQSGISGKSVYYINKIKNIAACVTQRVAVGAILGLGTAVFFTAGEAVLVGTTGVLLLGGSILLGGFAIAGVAAGLTIGASAFKGICY